MMGFFWGGGVGFKHIWFDAFLAAVRRTSMCRMRPARCPGFQGSLGVPSPFGQKRFDSSGVDSGACCSGRSPQFHIACAPEFCEMGPESQTPNRWL